MILVDANLLLYAYNKNAEHHKASRDWLERTLTGSQLVGFAWVSIWAFLRISTNVRVFAKPLATAEAEGIVASWLDQSIAGIVEPGDRHWEILRRLMKSGQVSGPLVMDAVLAAIAIEHDAILHSCDRDFVRFPNLKLHNPIA